MVQRKGSQAAILEGEIREKEGLKDNDKGKGRRSVLQKATQPERLQWILNTCDLWVSEATWLEAKKKKKTRTSVQ